jgi:hypothetical protein
MGDDCYPAAKNPIEGEAIVYNMTVANAIKQHREVAIN